MIPKKISGEYKFLEKDDFGESTAATGCWGESASGPGGTGEYAAGLSGDSGDSGNFCSKPYHQIQL